MTVIAYDGKTLAADRLATCGDTVATATKIWSFPSGGGVTAIAVTGDQAPGRLLVDWWKSNKWDNPMAPVGDKLPWPKCQDDKDHWARLIVATRHGCWMYERYEVAVEIQDRFMAWGCGREVALGALEMGASAERAVEIASKWVQGCGRGVDVVKLRD